MSAPKPPLHPLARQALMLLALMTVACLGGPLLIALVLAGGRHDRWPPDRPIEWAVLIGVTAAVVLLMLLAVALARANQRASRPR